MGFVNPSFSGVQNITNIRNKLVRKELVYTAIFKTTSKGQEFLLEQFLSLLVASCFDQQETNEAPFSQAFSPYTA